ncbi:MAG: FAD-dependent oxidoreductase [Alphaproteobacteria bacterium]|nr:FAD-dependent oxidoreductase [Alphaproteobacteria bacterium]
MDKKENFITDSEIFDGRERRAKRIRPAITIKEAARETDVFAQTDVLVIGGGPAGTAAAIAAGREGVKVMLVERYNHLGGLSTGGLVIWIDRMTDWSGKQIIVGIAKDFMSRLPQEAVQGPSREDWGSADVETAAYWKQRTAAFHGITTWSPTIDPEALKTLSMKMALEQGVDLVFHALAVQPIVEDGAMKGAIFESKEGRLAILSKVVIDTTGDADLLARAGLEMDRDTDKTDIHHCINTSFLIGGVDMEKWLKFRADASRDYKNFMAEGRKEVKSFEQPFTSWRNDIALFMGPRLSGYSALDVEDLSEVEVRSRFLTVAHVEFYQKHAPGFEKAFLMLGAPQVGVRHSRRLKGMDKVVRADWGEGKVWDNEIGVSTSLSPKFPNISVPYGALVPTGIEGVLAAGRHVCCDVNSHSFLREIPQCWLTGQAAGVAGALAANLGIVPSKLDPRLIQKALVKQGVYLSPKITANL